MIYSFAAKSILRVWDAFVFGIVNLCFIARHPYEFEQLFRRTIRVGGRSANMAAPSVPNTKHVWRKHIDRDPRFIMLSNKLAVKEFVKTLGTEVAPPETLWVGHPDELPEEFYTADVVIKSTHGNGTNVYPARDKMTSEQVRAAVRKAYDQPHGVKTNEWGYLHVKREIFVEERVGVGQQLADLKVTTFGGVAHHVVRITGSDHRNRAAGRWIVGADGALALDDEPSAISPDTIDNTPLPASISRGLETATQIGRYFDRMGSTSCKRVMTSFSVKSLSTILLAGSPTDTSGSRAPTSIGI